jgi:hypothetical protein
MLNFPGHKRMQIKSALVLHLIPVRTLIINNTNNECWGGCGEAGTLIHCWWGYKLVQCGDSFKN